MTVGAGTLAPPLADGVSPDEADACENVESASAPFAGTGRESVAGAAVPPMAFDAGRSTAACGFVAALSAAAKDTAGGAFAAEAGGTAALAGAGAVAVAVAADGSGAVSESEVDAVFDPSDAVGAGVLGFAAVAPAAAAPAAAAAMLAAAVPAASAVVAAAAATTAGAITAAGAGGATAAGADFAAKADPAFLSAAAAAAA